MDAQPLGRWIAPDTIVPDPADPQSLNRYGYVLNNPLRYSDPSGHQYEIPNPFEWLAEFLGFGSAKKLETIPAYQDLTVDVGETYYETLKNTGEVLSPVAEAGLSLMPGGSAGYGLATSITGETITGEQLSSGSRIVGGALSLAGFTPLIKPFGSIPRPRVPSGWHAHHLVEKRFWRQLGFGSAQEGTDEILAAMLPGDTHIGEITRQIRLLIDYGSETEQATLQQIWNAHRDVYTDYDWGAEVLDVIWDTYFAGKGVIR